MSAEAKSPSFFGRIGRFFKPHKSNWGAWILRHALAEMVIAIIAQAVLLYTIIKSLTDAKFTTLNWNTLGTTPFILVYMFLFIVGLIFHTLLVWDAVRNQNSIQIVGAVAFNIALTAYSMVQLVNVEKLDLCFRKLTGDNNQTGWIKLRAAEGCPDGVLAGDNWQAVNLATQGLKLALFAETPVVVVMIFFCLIGFYISWMTYHDFGWKIFGILGASIHRRNMLRYYHIFLVLLKSNVFFALGMIIQVITFLIAFVRTIFIAEYGESIITLSEPSSYILVTAAVVIVITTFAAYFTGWIGVRKASEMLMTVFIVNVALNTIALLAILAVNWKENLSINLWISLFGGLSTLTNITLIAVAVICKMKFKHGLSDLVANHLQGMRNRAESLDTNQEKENAAPLLQNNKPHMLDLE